MSDSYRPPAESAALPQWIEQQAAGVRDYCETSGIDLRDEKVQQVVRFVVEDVTSAMQAAENDADCAVFAACVMLDAWAEAVGA